MPALPRGGCHTAGRRREAQRAPTLRSWQSPTLQLGGSHHGGHKAPGRVQEVAVHRRPWAAAVTASPAEPQCSRPRCPDKDPDLTGPLMVQKCSLEPRPFQLSHFQSCQATQAHIYLHVPKVPFLFVRRISMGHQKHPRGFGWSRGEPCGCHASSETHRP